MAGLEGYSGFLTDMIQGSTKDFIIRLKRTENGVVSPVDLTGSAFWLTLDKDRDIGTNPAYELHLTNLTNALEGYTQGKIPAAITASLPKGGYFYSLRWINSSGDPYVVDLGTVNVNRGVSNRA